MQVSHPCSKKMNNMKYDGEDAADPVRAFGCVCALVY